MDRLKFFFDSKGKIFWLDDNGVSFEEKFFKWTDSHDKQLLTAKNYIKFCCKERTTPNKHNTSYGYKHAAERFGEMFNKFNNTDIFSSYISNGVFILAAKELRIKTFVVRGSLNCYFSMTGISHYEKR